MQRGTSHDCITYPAISVNDNMVLSDEGAYQHRSGHIGHSGEINIASEIINNT